MRLTLAAHRVALLVLVCVVHGLGAGVREAEAVGGDGFVRAQGTRFVLNGSPYYANGFNAYWLMSMAADPSQRGKVTAALSEAAGHGLTVARTWAFSDGGGTNALQYSPGNYNENTFKGLDFVLSEARKYGIKVILSLVNSYDSFGGRKQYVNWARAQGQGIGSDDEFFTNPVVKGFYKNHIKTVLTRKNTITGAAYRDDPTILAWELMNEPRCQSDLSGRTIQSWITEMAAHVKSIDGNHMLEVGLEGFYGASTPSRVAAVNPSGYQLGTDFIANNQVPGVDFATVHSYPDQWLSSKDEQAQLTFMGSWLDAHIADASTSRRAGAAPRWGASSGSSWWPAWTRTATATRSSSARRRPPPASSPPTAGGCASSARRSRGPGRCGGRAATTAGTRDWQEDGVV
uniref:mannan endo-1,4-beta-mannosidase n=1 Tax=Oryza brachyantha TaxID=4533 RepID=J3L2L8_ORYBR